MTKNHAFAVQGSYVVSCQNKYICLAMNPEQVNHSTVSINCKDLLFTFYFTLFTKKCTRICQGYSPRGEGVNYSKTTILISPHFLHFNSLLILYTLPRKPEVSHRAICSHRWSHGIILISPQKQVIIFPSFTK